jgi:peptidoglycan/xylan/chitin deacetylase (PgdA/CDA1 family)
MFHPNDTLQKIRQHEDLWDLYTRKEEYSPRQLDRHGRFVYAHSTNRDVLEPRVSKQLVNNGYEIKYPDGKQFAVCLTHDVDEIYPPHKHTLLSTLTCLKGLDFSGFKRQAFWKLDGKEQSPYWNFQEIMDLEEKYGARSSFYFLATDADIRRFRYNIEDLKAELGQIVDRGWEVGLHGGYYAYNDLEEILREKERLERALGRKITGYRNHYLRFQVPDSWEILEKAGFGYDTTLGYPDMVGFRNGMCHPFRPFNRNTNAEIDIWELPLVIMDGTLFEMSGSFQDAWDIAKRCIDAVSLQNGILVVNWHSNSFNCPFKHQWENIYKNLLMYCKQQGAWLTNAEEIIKFWQENAFL